jgi:RNA polymerase primary sigma factor
MDITGLTQYMREIGKQPPLDRDEEQDLARIIKKNGAEADQAKEVMIEANLRLVVAIAKENQNRGLELEDLIAEGNVGLIKAIERFDPEQGNKLSTYACWWIRQQIQLAVSEQTKTIRMPPHASDKLRRIRKIVESMTGALGRPPSVEEIAEETTLDPDKIEEILSWGTTTLSLNQCEADSDTPMENFLEDGNAENPLGELLKKSDAQWINKVLDCLQPREREIVERRFGIGRVNTRTLEEIGEEFGVTRERIRQLEARALKKIRRKLSGIKSLGELA